MLPARDLAMALGILVMHLKTVYTCVRTFEVVSQVINNTLLILLI